MRRQFPTGICIQIVFWIALIYCIWGLVEFKQVINFRKLAKAVIGTPCQNLTINILEPYTETPYKDCMDYHKYLPRDKFYCYQVELSNLTFVHLDFCFHELSGDVTEDYTVFTKDFSENPFEISLFITVIFCCILFVSWAIWTLRDIDKEKKTAEKESLLKQIVQDYAVN